MALRGQKRIYSELLLWLFLYIVTSVDAIFAAAVSVAVGVDIIFYCDI